MLPIKKETTNKNLPKYEEASRLCTELINHYLLTIGNIQDTVCF